jgi:hypothetical protein
LARARATIPRNEPGRPVRSGSWVRIRIAVAGAESPWNGVRPVAANITTAPQAKMSAAGLSRRLGCSSKRSGAM